MQQKIESPQQFIIAPEPTEKAVTKTAEPHDYDDGLLATGGPIMISAMGLALLIAATTFFASGEALFAVVISVFYVAIFFGLPGLMARIRSGQDTRWQPDTPRKRDYLVQTYTGIMKRHEAVMQMVIVPIGVAFAFAGFSLIWILARPW